MNNKPCKGYRHPDRCDNTASGNSPCTCGGNCSECNYFELIRSPECERTECAYNNNGHCVYAKAFGGRNPTRGEGDKCFVLGKTERRTFTITYREHLIHQFEVEAANEEEAKEYFRDHAQEFDFSDGDLYDSEIEVEEKDYE